MYRFLMIRWIYFFFIKAQIFKSKCINKLVFLNDREIKNKDLIVDDY